MLVVVGGPFELFNEGGLSYWGSPSFGTQVGQFLDLSAIAQQAETVDVANRGNGLFPLNVGRLEDIPAEYHTFEVGTTDPDAITLDAGDRAAYSSLYGLSLPDTEATLGEANRLALMDLSDPSENGIGSLEPQRKGSRYNLTIGFGGYQHIERFDRGHKHVQKWLARHHKKVLRIQSERGDEHAGKYIGAVALRIKQATGSVNESLLIPSGSGLSVIPPETTVTDDFSGDLSAWTQDSGSWSISSGQLTVSGGSALILHDTDVSDDDFHVEINVASKGHDRNAPAVIGRYDAMGNEYMFRCRWNSTTGFQLYKRVLFSYTLLQEVSTGTNDGVTIKLDMSGSTIRGLVDDVEVASVTDSAISGNLSHGLRRTTDDGADPLLDDYEASDGLGGGGGGHKISSRMRRRKQQRQVF